MAVVLSFFAFFAAGGVPGQACAYLSAKCKLYRQQANNNNNNNNNNKLPDIQANPRERRDIYMVVILKDIKGCAVCLSSHCLIEARM